MASKVLILLGLIAFLFVVSEMAAAGTVKSESEETVQPDDYGGGGHGGHGGGGYGGGGGYTGGGGGGYCRHGCCYRDNNGCTRCCSYAGEAVQTQPGH